MSTHIDCHQTQGRRSRLQTASTALRDFQACWILPASADSRLKAREPGRKHPVDGKPVRSDSDTGAMQMPEDDRVFRSIHFRLQTGIAPQTMGIYVDKGKVQADHVPKKPVNARRLIRKMRGGTQAHLIEADDDNHYVVKFRNNPQTSRVLINELVASELLGWLHIATPQYALVNVTDRFLADNPEIYLQTGSRRIAAESGCHFGSQHPTPPESIAVYDFLPDSMLGSLVNAEQFRAILVFDRWAGNTDGRQTIFFRGRTRQLLATDHPRRLGLMALMIDNGFVFNGPHWNMVESDVSGIYHRHIVYNSVTSLSDFDPWISRIHMLTPGLLEAIGKRIPLDWLEGERIPFSRLMESLWQRRNRLETLIENVRNAPGNPFPNWRRDSGVNRGPSLRYQASLPDITRGLSEISEKTG